MSSELSILRKKLLSAQLWMENQIDLGLMDVENTPDFFDRNAYKFRKLEEDLRQRTIGSHCHKCGIRFKFQEEKKTSNHIHFYHPNCNP